jgi:hypothetical protein
MLLHNVLHLTWMLAAAGVENIFMEVAVCLVSADRVLLLVSVSFKDAGWQSLYACVPVEPLFVGRARANQ